MMAPPLSTDSVLFFCSQQCTASRRNFKYDKQEQAKEIVWSEIQRES